MSCQDVSALISGVSSSGQSSFVVKITGPGRLIVHTRVAEEFFLREWPDQRRRITSRLKLGGNPRSASNVGVSPCFRQRLNIGSRDELVVFLKPTLVRSRSEADAVTDELAAGLRALGYGRR